jgi:cytidyltransferase-like protein
MKKNFQKKYEFGAMVGRFCPLHLGHEEVIRTMLNRCERSIVIVGSADVPWSLPTFFDHTERIGFIRTIFPDISAIPLPDFPGDDAAWIKAIDDILISFGMPPEETVFFGGSGGDVSVLAEQGRRKTHIVDRFDGTTPVISATEVRDALIAGRDQGAMLNPLIRDDVRKLWNDKWPDFMKHR